MYRGLARIRSGRHSEGIDDVKQGIALWTATGGKFNGSLFHAEAALCLLGRGLYDEAAEFLGKAEKAQSDTEERTYEAEIVRLRGRILLANGNLSLALSAFRSGFTIAQQRGTHLFGLRAACDWVRETRVVEDKRDAGKALKSSYSWFTEGFDTPDLKEAKALLEELE
jgi:predicted ATPase